MSTYTNTSKSSAPTYANSNKPSTTWNRYSKAGQGWQYDQEGITYDGPNDVITGLPIYYDSLGTNPTWTNQNKSI